MFSLESDGSSVCVEFDFFSKFGFVSVLPWLGVQFLLSSNLVGISGSHEFELSGNVGLFSV